ncbi:MAG TPA: glycine zipper domain-containing protein [Burkholderiales bacterium]|nr:glycine zipper domain-containing protein [Burkholderiales bacterium]
MTRAACLLLACVMLLAGCATNGSEEESTRTSEPAPEREARTDPKPPPSPPRNEKTVRYGTVDSIRPVTLPGKDSGAGALVGAVMGGIGGAEVGKGRGSAVGAVIGTVAGSLAGAAIEDQMTRREALEIIVELDNTGELRAITQETGAGTFQRGERVRLVTGGGITRVEKLSKKD